jgi:hypothetical protein
MGRFPTTHVGFRPIGRGTVCALAALALVAGLGAGMARGERSQQGNLIVSLDGGLSPLKLPRDRTRPVAVRLEGGLQTADGSQLPRVTRIELGLPQQGVLSTRGLPTCSQRRLRNTKPFEALAACRPALIGRGRLEANVVLPNQAPFTIQAGLLAFNGRVGGHRAILLHAFAASPPTVAVVPFLIRPGSGRFGTALVADLPAALGPWPHFAHFAITLSRHYVYRGRSHSYLSASCPIPPRFTAGFFSFARATLTLAGGRTIGTGIARGCRAR